MAKRAEFYKELGIKVEQILFEKKMSQTDLAKQVGLSQSQISSFINQGEKLSAERINQIFDVLGYELAPVEKKSCTAQKLATCSGFVTS